MGRLEYRAVPLDDEAYAQTLSGQWSAANHEQKTNGVGIKNFRKNIRSRTIRSSKLYSSGCTRPRVNSPVKCPKPSGRYCRNCTVDAKQRKLIWPDGKRLDLDESVQNIHTDYPEFPRELIESRLISWLDTEYAPPSYSPEQLDELDQLTERWINDHFPRSGAR